MSEREFSTFLFLKDSLPLEKCQALLLCFAPSLKVGFLLGEIVIKRSTVASVFEVFYFHLMFSRDERKFLDFLGM